MERAFLGYLFLTALGKRDETADENDADRQDNSKRHHEITDQLLLEWALLIQVTSLNSTYSKGGFIACLELLGALTFISLQKFPAKFTSELKKMCLVVNIYRMVYIFTAGIADLHGLKQVDGIIVWV